MYEGGMLNNKKHGYGKDNKKNGNTYEGYFKQNRR